MSAESMQDAAAVSLGPDGNGATASEQARET